MNHFGRAVALAAVAALTLSACPRESAIWVEPGSTATHLVFGVGKSRNGPPLANLYGITVVPCGREDRLPGAAVWILARSEEIPAPVRVTYGEPPRGYVSRKAPGSLQPGCYRAEDSGSGRVEFDVDASGQVHERKM